MDEEKVISFKALKDKYDKGNTNTDDKLPGQLVWLYCPTCETIEHTPVLAPNGRTHKCGSVVSEQVVNIDLRAEFTLAIYNIALLDKIIREMVRTPLRFLKVNMTKRFLENLAQSERAYITQLVRAAGNRELEMYELSTREELLRLTEGIVEDKTLGILTSPFRFNPADRFSRQKKP